MPRWRCAWSRWRAWPALAAACCLPLGCGAGEPAKERTAKPTRAPAASTPAPTPQAPAGRTLRFRAADGTQLRGTLTPARSRRSPAVVLVHQVDGGPDEWDDFIPYLHQAGYATLAYSSRGHFELDETLLARDIAGAVRALSRRPEVDPRRLGVIGASIGATATSWFAGTSGARGVRAFVALSPAGFDTAPKHYRPHRLLLLADAEEVPTAREIADAAATDVRVEKTAVYGHGASLLGDAKVRATVLGWLDERLR